MKIIYDNIFNYRVSVTASTEQSGYEFSTALSDTRLCRVGRFVGITSEDLVFTMPNNQYTAEYIIVRCNIDLALTDGGAGSVTFQGSDTAAWGTPDFSADMTHVGGGVYVLYRDTATSYDYKYYRFVFNSATPYEYIEVNSIFAAYSLTLPPMAGDQAIPTVSTALTYDSLSGQHYGNPQIRVKAATINFPVITATEHTQIETFFNVVDTVTPFELFVWEDDLTIQPPIYCALTTDLQWQKVAIDGLTWSLKLSFRECR